MGQPNLALRVGTSVRSPLIITAAAVGDSRVLTVYGVLDDTTYVRLRDAVIKAALDEYRALIIDVTRLAVAAPAALPGFTTASSGISQRSDIPIALVCDSIMGQKALHQNGINLDIPVYWRIGDAIAALPDDDEHRPTIPLRTGPGGRDTGRL